ncbi:MAG: ABC transporter substrate-binding protein [Pseudomonadota bacterium]
MRRRTLLSAFGFALLAVPAMAEDRAERVVIAGGDLTEIAFALGAGDRVVGVDQTSTFPEATADLPQIGYVRRLSAEGVLSLRPDLLIVADDAGPDVALEQLQAAGTRVMRAPESVEAPEIADKIRFVGQALGEQEKAEDLVAKFQSDLDQITAKVATLAGSPRILFILSIRNGAPLIGGRGTTADEMIRLAGGRNAGSAIEGYKPMNSEAILAAAPDAILMMTQHAERLGGIDAVLSRPEIALTPAGRNARAVTMDGMLLLGFGPRTPRAIADLARALQPDAAKAAGL